MAVDNQTMGKIKETDHSQDIKTAISSLELHRVHVAGQILKWIRNLFIYLEDDI